jgi:hypothetical protein
VVFDFARALGMKVSIVAYDDGDSENKNGPIIPDVFVKCWEKCNRPQDLFEVVQASPQTFYNVNLAANWILGLPADVPGHRVQTLGEGREEPTWNTFLKEMNEGKLVRVDLETSQDQEIVNDSPIFVNQEFPRKTGVVYAEQKAIGA